METNQPASGDETPVETPESDDDTSADIFEFELPEVTPTDTDYSDIDGTATPAPGDVSPDATGEGGPGPGDDAEKHRGTLDDKGGAFDPALHAIPPEKTPSGRWKRIPKALRDKSKNSDEPKIEPNATSRMEAQKIAILYGTLHTIPFGAGGAITREEILPLVDSVERYFNEHGIIQTPPGIDLALSMAVYSMAVAQRSTNLEKVAALFARMKNWFSSFRKKKADKIEKGEKVPDGA